MFRDLRLKWHAIKQVLRGRPLMFNWNMEGSIVITQSDAMIVGCTVMGGVIRDEA